MEKEFQKNLVFSLVILAILRLVAGAGFADNRVYNECTEGQNFTRGGQTDKNLRVVLSTLANRTATSGGFNTSIYGKTPDSVYAMAQCRGDTRSSDCLSCLQSAIASVPQLCGTSPGGKFWHDQCFLRWEKDTDFIGKYDTTEEPHYFLNAMNASSDPAEFHKLVTGLMTNLTKQAVTNITRILRSERYSALCNVGETYPYMIVKVV